MSIEESHAPHMWGNKQISANATKIIESLKKGRLTEAAILYLRHQPHDPYNVEIETAFAQSYLVKKDMTSAFPHFVRVHNIDLTHFGKIKPESNDANTQSFLKKVTDHGHKNHYPCHDIAVNQVFPSQLMGKVLLSFDLERAQKLDNIIQSFDPPAQNFFYWEEKEASSKKLWLISSHHGLPVYYPHLFLAIKKISPLLHDTRFFINPEIKNHIDEFVIRQGQFFTYVHYAKDSYIEDKLEVLKKVADKNPDDITLRQFISLSYTESAKYNINTLTECSLEEHKEKCTTILQKAFAYWDKNTETHYQQGRLFDKVNNRDAAEKQYIKVIESKPNHFGALYDLGILFYKNKQFKQAINYLTQAIQIKDYHIWMYVYRGAAFEALGLQVDAESDYKKDIANTPLRLTASLFNVGDFLRNAAYYNSATLYYQAIIDSNKEHFKANTTSHASNQNAKAYVNLAVTALLQNNNYQQAIQYCNLAIKEEAIELEDAWYNKGFCLQQIQQLDQAEICYQNVLDKNKYHSKALQNLGIIMLMKSRFPQAIEYADRVLSQLPSHQDALMIKANAIAQQGQYQIAADIYQLILNHHPNSDQAYEGIALCTANMGRKEEAINYYKKAIEINRHNYHALANLGGELVDLVQYEEATYYLDRAIAINALYYYPYHCKACIYAMKNDIEGTITMLKQALSLAPEVKEVLQNEPRFEHIKTNDLFSALFEV